MIEQSLELVCFIVLWNVIVLLIYGYDKLAAIYHKRRIPEQFLLYIAFFFGGVGALIFLVFFRHKIRKLRFVILLPMSAVLTVAAVVGLSSF
ncbi:MAG: DUF1294 domain-containing protein [Culicoidibacterales bacterium]